MTSVPSPKIDIMKLVGAATTVMDVVRARDAGAPLRVFGSAAIAIRCPHSIYLWHKADRPQIRDVDIVTIPQYRPSLRKILGEAGFSESPDNDATNAQQRRLYFQRDDIAPFWLEVHSAPLMFHHRISLGKLLSTDSVTLTLADLAVSKLQWKELSKNNVQQDAAELPRRKQTHLDNDDAIGLFNLNKKLRRMNANTSQLIDLCVLFAEYSVTQNDQIETGISIERVLWLTRRDWELWTTLNQNFEALKEFASTVFPESEYPRVGELVLARVEALRSATDVLYDTTIRFRLQAVLHRILPKRLYPIGIEVDEPDEDIWNRTIERISL